MSIVPANVRIFETGEAVAQAAAAALCEAVAHSLNGRVSVCLAGGSTPKRLYRLLLEPCHSDRIPWDRVHWFWGDERFVPMRDERSNARMVWGAFLAYMPAPLENIHPVSMNTNSPAHSAELYEQELKRFYGADELDPARPLFDLVLLGLGQDGHTASLFPDSPALSERKRWVTSVERAGMEPYVPRVTLTSPALASGREVLFVVSGAGKQKALAQVLAGEDLPAAHVQPVGRLRWFADRAAAPEDR